MLPTTLGKARKRSRSLLVTLVTLVVSCLLAGSVSVLVPQEASAATVSDNFNRADGGLGSNWTTVAGTAAPAIVSNTLRAGTASKLNSAYWSASTFGNDQFAQASLPNSSGNQYGPGIAVRLSGSKGYFLWYGNSPNTVSLWRMDSSTSWTQLKQSGTLTVSPSSDVWKIQAVGSTISGYQNGNLVVQATDTNITSGSPGVWLYYASNQIDNWSGGDVTTYSVGGTVSGLSGTVVLQDNGGNDLSVSASGPFTFSTGLTTGSAYNVTVKTNPAGQTCSVANGSGTIGTANITNVAVTCTAATTYSVGGTVSGLSGTVVLQDNGGDNLSVGTSGAFTFATALATGSAYNVTVKTNPSGQTCSVANGSGTVGTANITNVAVTCTTNSAGNASDNFNRADGGLGSNWTTVAGTAAPAIVSNTLRAGTASKLNSAYWSASTFGNDQFAQASLPNSSGNQYGPGIAVRLSGSKGYFLWYGNSPNTVSLWRMDSSTSWTQLKQSGTLTVSPSSDVWKIQAVGSTISGYQNGNLVVQATDTNITSGSPGVWLYYASNQIDNWSGGDVTTYSVGGTVSGLSGTVVLQDNGGNDLSVSASGPFTFSTGLTTGSAYNVTVKTNPAGQTCSVANGSGTIGTANITNVAVTCTAATTYSVGGTVSGLSGTVVLQDNGGDNLSVGTSGAFTFATALATGSAYNVTVKTNPSGQTCSVANGSGTVGTANITNVAVTCTAAAATYSVGGTVSGLSGTVVLQDNGGDNLSVGTSGAFTFATALATGSAYNVTVKTNPSGQTCSVANGSGTVGSANITNVAVTCTAAAATYSVGGTVSGLSGTVVLQDNGGDNLSVGTSGAFTFATALATGSAYNVTVKTNPSGQTCSVANGSGTVGSANITNVAVTCTANTSGNASDNFNRADGPLGPNWTDMSDGGLTISSQAAAGTSATGVSGDMRTAESYSSNQYSQIEVTSTQLTGNQWIGPAVRTQNGGQDGYLGIYSWNNGSPELMLFRRSSGNWTELGSSYSSGPLAAGTQLKLMVVGSTLSFLENGVERIAVYDNTFSGGAPGSWPRAPGRPTTGPAAPPGSRRTISARTPAASSPTT